MKVIDFLRVETGEGVQREAKDFAQEVKEMAGK